MRTDYSFSFLKGNLITIPIALLFTVAAVVVHELAWPGSLAKRTTSMLVGACVGIAVSMALFVPLTVLGVHLAGAHKHAVSWGFKWRALTLYANLVAAISMGKYRLVLLLPPLVLGLLPILLGLVTGRPGVLIAGVVGLSLATPGLLVIWISRAVKSQTMVQDYAGRIGFKIVESP